MAKLNEQPMLPSAMTEDIVASIRDGIITVDSVGRLTSLNLEAEAIFGLRATDVVGKVFAEVFLPLEDLDAFNDCVLEAIYHPDSPHSADITVRIGDTQRHLSVRANLLRDSDAGSAIGVLVVISDVSERIEFLARSAEQERERAATGRFIVAILTIFSVFTLLLEPMQKLAESRFFDFGPVIALLTLVVIAFLITRWTNASLSAYGLNFRPRRRDVYEAVVWSVGFCVLMTLAKYLELQLAAVPGQPVPPLFAFFVLDDGTKVDTVGIYALGLGIYLVSVLFQQFATRCAIQAPLENFLTGVIASPGWVANVTATLLFAVLHAHLNPIVSLLVILPSLLWGWLFMRSHSV
ncbi:MAG: PAS domain-containing protein, partial [Candidatus Competibacteraceae bacterium]|nr:PAS domain-containing protein [Candidatus Competibacteraceae bacterium]